MKYDGYMRATAAGQVDRHCKLGITLVNMTHLALVILDNINDQSGPQVPPGWFTDISKASMSTGFRSPRSNRVGAELWLSDWLVDSSTRGPELSARR
jgi:hypothetical protein